MNIMQVFKSNRLMKAVTGITISEFELLLQLFEKALYEKYINKTRKRAIGGGRKGALPTTKEKLLFILFYIKVYPTYDIAGFIFQADRRRAFEWVKTFMPLLEKALGRAVVMPKRKINSIEEFINSFSEIKDIFIDGTERRIQRPLKTKNQKKKYSGKKKTHTRKNTIICDENKRVLCISPSKDGKIHDLQQLKKSQLIESIPSEVAIWVDKGYQGIKKIVKNNSFIMIPHKKIKNKTLTIEQKEENKVMAGIRVVAEHAISGIKRFACLVNICRCRRGQDDQWIGICGGLWNFHLQYKNC